MNLMTKSQFAEHCGKGKSAISNALKQGRLETFQDTGKINPNSPKSQKFLATTHPSQKNTIALATSGSVEEPDQDLRKAGKKVLLAQEKKIIEEAALKEQQRIEKEIKNAVRLGELVEISAINESIMMFIDRWLSENERGFNGKYLEFKRLVLDVEDGKKSDNEVRSIFKDWFLERAHIAKTTTTEKLREIQNEQGRK